MIILLAKRSLLLIWSPLSLFCDSAGRSLACTAENNIHNCLMLPKNPLNMDFRTSQDSCYFLELINSTYPCFMTCRFHSFITSFSPSLTSVNSSSCYKKTKTTHIKLWYPSWLTISIWQSIIYTGFYVFVIMVGNTSATVTKSKPNKCTALATVSAPSTFKLFMRPTQMISLFVAMEIGHGNLYFEDSLPIQTNWIQRLSGQFKGISTSGVNELNC